MDLQWQIMPHQPDSVLRSGLVKKGKAVYVVYTVFSDGTCEITSRALCPGLGSLEQRQTLTHWFEPSGELPSWSWGWSTWHTGRGSGNGVCSS